jgi:hypothetical protein
MQYIRALALSFALAAGIASAYTVSFVGNETSNNGNAGAADWGTTVDAGGKGAWRNTSTATKAYLLPDDGLNAYGKDGYICFSTSDKSQEEGGTFAGSLYTGSRAGNVFTNTTRYLASIELVNYREFWGGVGAIDNPAAGISGQVGAMTPGEIVVNFSVENGVASTVTVFRLTFNANVADHPVVRVGLACGRGDSQNPLAYVVGGVVGELDGSGQYGYRHWSFFDIEGAAGGDTVDIAVSGNPQNGHLFTCLNLISLDSEAHFVNAAPEILSIAATPSTVAYTNWNAGTTLAVDAWDPEGDDLSYVWSPDGEQPGSFLLASRYSATCGVSVATAGTYTFRVGVSDGNNLPVFTNVPFTVTIPEGEPHAAFVGFEYTTPGHAVWGSTNYGDKASFRSLATGNPDGSNRKNYLLPDHPNAYGLDGYVFLGNCRANNQDLGPVVTGTLYGNTLVSNATDYIASYEAVYVSRLEGSCYAVDDPRQPLAAEVSDFIPGQWWAWNLGNEFHTIARITFNEAVASHPRVRIAILSGRGDNQKPSHIGVGGVHAEWNGYNAYGTPDWAFFDVIDARPGDTVEIDLRSTRNTAAAIEGILFDSVCTVPNAAPSIASIAASPSPAVATNWTTTVALSATATDPEDDPIHFSWSCEGVQPGPVTLVADATANCTAHLPAVAGTYIFRLDITDLAHDTTSTNLSVALSVPDTCPHAAFVGFESTYNPHAAWGAPAGGNKGTFRSLATGNEELDGLKNYLLPGHANAYGLDGYVFLGNCRANNQDLGPLATGTLYGNTLVSNATGYIESFAATHVSALEGSCYAVDDPRADLSDDVSDIVPGEWWVRNTGTRFATVARITLGREVRRHPQIRIGLLSGRGDGQKPTQIRIGGLAADWVGANAYGYPDIAFFDLMNARPGDVVDIDLRSAHGGQMGIQGILFDSVAVGPPGTILLLR